MQHKYGIDWPENVSQLDIEFAAFLLELTPEQGGLGKAQHCRNIIDALWNYEGSTMRFDWHPWAEKMNEEACAHKFLGVAGCASSGKSDYFAVYAIVNFLADPRNTKVLVTSTTLKDSRLRIWGRIREYWSALQPGFPGKLVDTYGVIKFVDPDTGEAFETSGISLIAGDKKKEKESIGNMIGFKRRRMIMIADELPELSPAILEAALSNLDAGNPFFQLIGIGNPNSRYDAFGVFCRPKAGWKTVTADSSEWETDYGWCIRFDGEKSPNILAGKTLYPYMLTAKKLADKKRQLGENSLMYWRMYRGFWCPTGSDAGLFSEADIVLYGADERDVKWSNSVERVAFLDTAFTEGGDRAMVHLGWYGRSTEGKYVLLYDEETIQLSEDITKTDEAIGFQIAKQYRDLCKREGVYIENAGVDSTGGGAPFCDILATVWGSGFYRCMFGGSPSDRQVSSTDTRTCKEAYANRVSEIWGSGPEFIRTGQLKGMSPDFIREATARLYTTKTRGSGVCIQVEPKTKMKARSGMSPDIADAGLGLLDLCRERKDFMSVEGDSIETGTAGRQTSWEQVLQEGDRLTQGSWGGEETYRDHGFIPLNFS